MIEAMYQVIDNVADKSVGVGASPDDIRVAEATLGVSFPESYRAFLRRYGWAVIGFNEFYGLGADVPHHLHLIRNTLVERTTMEPRIPHSLVPVLNDGAGNHYCLATERMVNGECPVVFWDHEQGPNQDPITEGESFAEWIINYLRES
ncbi:SMI1/KNR4 family protein [Thermogutta sp.]|uniref:SMI1/KNR4 family protein n=1 Tax=Thermogutta sp. TaxID=1962930 RepID=UPI0025CD03F9|nr:SMI1/KNR4 family protein [Thermogutta sp.]